MTLQIRILLEMPTVISNVISNVHSLTIKML